MARAWSVWDWKEAVNWVASQSREGTDCRGNLAAWVSGAVKSRQTRHGGPVLWVDKGWTWVCECTWGLGLLDWNFAMSGRDERGIGGGAPCLGGVGLGSLPLTPCVTAGSSGLFMP